jgi:hypothetical protein
VFVIIHCEMSLFTTDDLVSSAFHCGNCVCDQLLDLAFWHQVVPCLLLKLVRLSALFLMNTL